jgi:hypothetical protein
MLFQHIDTFTVHLHRIMPCQGLRIAEVLVSIFVRVKLDGTFQVLREG